MTDLGTLEAPKTGEMSTVLGSPSDAEPSGGGAPKPDPAPEPKSLRDTIEDVVKGKPEEPAKEEPIKDDAKEEKPDDDQKGGEQEKDAKEEKPVKDEKKPETEVKDDPEDNDAKESSDKNNPAHDAPKKFLPDAKEKWMNVPNVVKRDIHNLMREHETQIQTSREATERYEVIRDFDELARQNGRDLRESLIRVNEIENELASNPIAGLNRILMEAGPRKPDGQPISLFEVAQFIVQQGQQGYQSMVSQPQQQQQQQPQSNPEVEQLRQQIMQMQEQQVATSIIEPFRAENPRYDELKEDIAFFLKSGKIPAGYSPTERLEAAYDMAVRINPASHIPEVGVPEDRAAESFAGSKSIKSAPGAVSNTMELERGGSIRDVLEQERKRFQRS